MEGLREGGGGKVVHPGKEGFSLFWNRINLNCVSRRMFSYFECLFLITFSTPFSIFSPFLYLLKTISLYSFCIFPSLSLSYLAWLLHLRLAPLLLLYLIISLVLTKSSRVSCFGSRENERRHSKHGKYIFSVGP